MPEKSDRFFQDYSQGNSHIKSCEKNKVKSSFFLSIVLPVPLKYITLHHLTYMSNHYIKHM